MIVVMHHTDAKLAAACYYAADLLLSEQADGRFMVVSNRHGPSGIMLPAKLPVYALKRDNLYRLIQTVADQQKGQ